MRERDVTDADRLEEGGRRHVCVIEALGKLVGGRDVGGFLAMYLLTPRVPPCFLCAISLRHGAETEGRR